MPRVTEEDQFEDAIIAEATLRGWHCHATRRVTFTRDADGAPASGGQPIKGHRGYPDLTLAHPFLGIILAELKTDKGKLGVGQPEWIDVLARYDVPGSPVLVELWRPRDRRWITLALEEGVHAYRETLARSREAAAQANLPVLPSRPL